MIGEIEQIFETLGYTNPLLLPGKGGVGTGSLRVDDPSGKRVLIRFARASAGDHQPASIYQTRSWHTALHVTAPQGASSDDPVRDDSNLLEEMRQRWELGAKAGGHSLSPILEFGKVEGYLYEVRPYYLVTLDTLLSERRPPPSAPMLFRVVDQIWAALGFLHQSGVNVPHGAVTTCNLGFDSRRIMQVKAWLLDLRKTPVTSLAKWKRQDFRDLGRVIYQFANNSPGPVDAQDAALRCPNADWSHLARAEKGWKELICRLLAEDGFREGYDLAGSREKLLGPLREKGTSFEPVPAPLSVTGEPPYRRHQVDYPSKMSRLLEASDPVGAMRLLVDIPDDYEPSGQVLQWADDIADTVETVAADASIDSEFLVGLEKMATRGSLRCALRLGVWLAKKNQPAEALRWLGEASKAGLTESYPVIAEIYEWGGDGVEADPQRALDFYRAAFDEAPETAWETGYRMAALILRERGKALAEHLPLAEETLQRCHDGGHFKATDLLAQCIAHGVGGMAVDEQRALELFQDAWKRSVDGNQPYYTAAHNLGVCHAVGFGTDKDPNKAREYFEQGERAGHEESKSKLQSLAQTS